MSLLSSKAASLFRIAINLSLVGAFITSVRKEVHLLKAPSPMAVIVSGMVRSVNVLQSARAHGSMAVTESGMVMFCNDVH